MGKAGDPRRRAFVRMALISERDIAFTAEILLTAL
jgi:hypothetical protein